MKIRLLAAALVLCLLMPSFSNSAFATDATVEISTTALTVSALVDGEMIQTVEVDGELYLFLPVTADLEKLVLLFTMEEGKVVVEETVNVPSLIKKDSKGRYALKTNFKDYGSVKYYIMQGSSIPTLYLTSGNEQEDRTWVDASKKHEAEGSMKLVTSDGTTIYDGKLTQIKARGNSTFTYYPKKAYQIKLKDKTDLLGTGEKVKTWVLLANYGDATLMHDKLFKDLASELGMSYVASTDWVNLYYDGEYRGVYLLSEKNSVGSTSVDITDMEEAYEEINSSYGNDMVGAEGQNAYGQKYLYTENLTEPEDISSGWLIELNNKKVDEASGFYTEKDVGVNVKSPEWAGKQAMEYISEYYQAFEKAVYATDETGVYTGFNIETGKNYDEYVDRTSLIRTFLLQELALNPDGFNSSLYFYKDTEGILHAGPIWDQDMTLGTGWSKYISPKIKDYHYLAEGLIQIPEFEEATVKYFYEKFIPEVEEWLGEDGKIAEYKALLADSAAMNYVLWPYVRVGKPSAENHLWADGTDYDTVTKNMTNWVEQRLQVLKETFIQKEDSQTSFADVAGHWAEDAINYVAEKGLFGGTGKGFEPELTMNRAMLVTTLFRLEGSPAGYTHNFTDVSENVWYNDAVAWASHNEIIQGYGNGLFGPNDLITREQFATILWRYAKSKGMDVSVGEDTNILSYEDAFSISEYAFAPLQWACGEGIIGGKPGGLLDPQGGATRAQAATIFMRFITQTE